MEFNAKPTENMIRGNAIFLGVVGFGIVAILPGMDGLIGGLLAFGGAIAQWFYASVVGTVLKVSEDEIEILKKNGKKRMVIPFSEIECAKYNELSFGAAIHLKNGTKIKLGSYLVKVSGFYTVPENSSAEAGGPPGDRLRLVKEINKRCGYKGDSSIISF